MHRTTSLFVASLLIALCAILVTHSWQLHLRSMATLAAARASNENYKPTYRPIGLFFGGTSGIGQAMAEKLAAQTAGRAHIVILGRNEQAAERIISGFPKHNESLYEFERIDATSMKDVRRVTRSLLNRLDKANFVITSPGFMTLKGRDESEDGLDKKLACHVYARFRFALDLVPLLENAANAGETAAFMSVLSAGKEPTSHLNLDDLGLKKEYTLMNAAAAASYYTDAYIEELARRHPKVSFTHICPGAVITPLVTNFHWSTKPLVPLLRLVAASPSDCAEWMWSPLWGSNPKAGAHRLSNHATPVPPNKLITPEVVRRIWDHVVEVTDM